MLQSEEQAIAEHSDSVPHSLVMFASNASNSKASSSSQNQSQNHGSKKEETGIISIEAEEEAGSITMVVHSMPTMVVHNMPIILILFRIFLHRIFRINVQLLLRITNLIIHLAKSVENQAIKLWIVTIG